MKSRWDKTVPAVLQEVRGRLPGLHPSLSSTTKGLCWREIRDLVGAWLGILNECNTNRLDLKKSRQNRKPVIKIKLWDELEILNAERQRCVVHWVADEWTQIFAGFGSGSTGLGLKILKVRLVEIHKRAIHWYLCLYTDWSLHDCNWWDEH